MLQRIRDRITGWVAGFIIFVIAIAFIFWGIDFGFFNRDYIALVNGEEVPTLQYRNAVQNQVSQAQRSYQDELPEVMMEQIRSATLESLVMRELLAQRSADRGFRVGNDLLMRSIQQIEAFQVDGKFSLDSYHARLAGAGRSPASFEADYRYDVQIGQIEDSVAGTEFLTSGEARRLIELFEQMREVSVARLSPEQFMDGIEISDADVQAYYEQFGDRFLTPETVTLRYLEIRGEDLSGEVAVTEDELLDYYESVKDRYEGIERRKVRHVLIDAGDDETAAFARAQSVAQRIQSGESFAAVAAEQSDDSGTASSGGDLGWVDHETFEGDLGKAIFAQPAGKVSDPVRSDFGFHVLLVDEVEGGSARSFEQVRATLETEYRNEKSAERYYARAETLAELAFENLFELETAAEALGLTVQEIPGFTRDNQTAFPGRPEVAEAAFSLATLEDGENSRLIELEKSHAVVVRVADHKLPQPRALDEVRDQIVASLKREKAAIRAVEEGAALLAEVQQGGSLEALAATHSAEFQPASFVRRRDRQLSPEVLDAVFRSAKPADAPVVGGQPLANGGYAVYAVSKVIPGLPGAVDAELRVAARQALSQQLGSATFDTYLQDMRQRAKVRVFEDTSDQQLPQQPL